MAVLDVCHGVMMAMSITLPPPEFDHKYAGKLYESVMDVRDVQGACGGESLILGSIYACSVLIQEAGVCRIVIPRVEFGIVTQAQQDRLRRHEIGHCNGWLASHEGAVKNYHLICEKGE
jgi:hypothetical protein